MVLNIPNTIYMDERKEIYVLELIAVGKTIYTVLNRQLPSHTYIGKKDCSITGFIDFNYIFIPIAILSWQQHNIIFTAKFLFSFSIWQPLGIFLSFHQTNET